MPLLVTPEVDEDLVRRGEVELVGPPSIDWLGVPLRVRDRTIGAVVVQSYSPGVRYTEADKDLLTFVSSHVALAIERQRTAEALRESRDLLHAVVEGSLDAVFAKDRDGRYLFMNTVAAAVLGRPPHEVVGRTDAQLFPADIARGFARSDQRILATGEIQMFEDTDAAWGGTRTFSVIKGPLRDADGAVIGVFGVARDITERRAADEALRRSEERYRTFIEHSTEGVWRFEIDPPCPVTLSEDQQIAHFYRHARIAECNDAMARMYGRSSAREIVGACPANLLARTRSSSTTISALWPTATWCASGAPSAT
jgi:PAS domain S-box-containing protein